MQERFLDWRDRVARFAFGATFAKWAEAALILLLIIQIARLFWSIVTPIGMYGEWQARRPAILAPAARQALFAAFDPFFRTENAGGAAQVTGLALQLFGTRMNEGSRQGSAIIATPDGVQSSYVAGDEIMPGVVLKQVAFDHVVIDRGGMVESLFIDQSGATGEPPLPAPGGPPAPAGAPAPPSGPPAGPLTAAMAVRDIAFQPRSEGGRVTGIIVSPKGGGEGFARAGFEAGDILTQINGRPVLSASDLDGLKGQLKPGGHLFFMVERGAATVPVNFVLSEGQ
jgi:general secretion pathway protein C